MSGCGVVGPYSEHVKRPFDLVVAFSLLILLSPVFLVVAVFVLVFTGRPVLFAQRRPGRCGEAFTLYKFRTMKDSLDKTGQLLPDAERLTSFGRLLRSLSIDELPELFNVLKGDMSLIGPRPLLAEYLDRYTPEQARRHDVRPGITGWAQINGRNALTWEEKFKFDVWYVDHVSLGLDLKILWRTMAGVLRREGIAAEGYATMPKFKGSHGSNEKR